MPPVGRGGARGQLSLWFCRDRLGPRCYNGMAQTTIPVSSRRAQRLFGKILVDDGLITPAQLDQALQEVEASGKTISELLVQRGIITKEHATQALAKQHNLRYINLSEYDIDAEVIAAVEEELARKYKIIPVDKTERTLTLALADPLNIFLLDDIRIRTRCEVIPLLAHPDQIDEAIERYYGNQGGALKEALSDLEESAEGMEVVESADDDVEDSESADGAPVIRLVNLLIAEAIRTRTSDIHIEPGEHELRIRHRIDGQLHEMPSPPKKMQSAIISRLKIMAEVDISERRKPQDGRFKIRQGNKVVDFRVSFCPTIHGEKVVLRLLDQGNLMLDMTRLGFEDLTLKRLERAILRPFGMLVVTGPTGSGKSTTLYSALARINDPNKNIMTVEDPVEFQLRGINQVQANPHIGFTFAEALRSFLRQDPDIIMVGEIRDKETAEIAIKAALTGHLVMSTLHTNDAASAIQRLTNMGVEPFLITASLNCVIAQRLCRRICADCKDAYTPTPELCEALGLSMRGKDVRSLKFYRGMGCPTCNETGYKGRVAVYEAMEMDDDIAAAVIAGAPSARIKNIARQNGMLTMRDSGIRKILDGLTTPEEVMSVTFENEPLEDRG